MPNGPLLPEPQLTVTRQGEDTYPRVIRQERRADGAQLVTLALPGLRRAKVWVPYSQWLELAHLDIHGPLAARLEQAKPPLRPDPELDDI